MATKPKKSSYFQEFVKECDANDRKTAMAQCKDKSSYANFLEAQLERVSAACESIQSCDKRITEVESRVLSIEERSASMTRLVSLAHECAERVRSETDEKFTQLSKQVGDDTRHLITTIQVMSDRITTLEQSITSLYGLFPRMESQEHRVDNYSNSLKLHEGRLQEYMTNLRSEMNSKNSSIEHLTSHQLEIEAHLSKHIMHTQDFENRLLSTINVLDEHATETLVQHKEDVNKTLVAISTRMDREFDQIEKMVVSKDSETKSLISKQGDYFVSEFATLERDSTTNLEKNVKELESTFTDRITSLKTETNERLKSIDEFLEDVQSRSTIFESKVTQQFEAFDNSLVDNTESIQQALQTTQVDIQSIHDDLSRTLKSIQQGFRELENCLDSHTTAITKVGDNFFLNFEAQTLEEFNRYLDSRSSDITNRMLNEHLPRYIQHMGQTLETRIQSKFTKKPTPSSSSTVASNITAAGTARARSDASVGSLGNQSKISKSHDLMANIQQAHSQAWMASGSAAPGIGYRMEHNATHSGHADTLGHNLSVPMQKEHMHGNHQPHDQHKADAKQETMIKDLFGKFLDIYQTEQQDLKTRLDDLSKQLPVTKDEQSIVIEKIHNISLSEMSNKGTKAQAKDSATVCSDSILVGDNNESTAANVQTKKKKSYLLPFFAKVTNQSKQLQQAQQQQQQRSLSSQQQSKIGGLDSLETDSWDSLEYSNINNNSCYSNRSPKSKPNNTKLQSHSLTSSPMAFAFTETLESPDSFRKHNRRMRNCQRDFLMNEK